MGTEQQQRTDQSQGAEQQQGLDRSDFIEQRREAEHASGDEQQRTEKPEVTDEHKKTAKEMSKAYEENPQTTTLPGTGGTVSGTAVTDWVDEQDKGKIETTAEEGKVEFRKTEEFRKKQEE
jgi:hypothetical protein